MESIVKEDDSQTNEIPQRRVKKRSAFSSFFARLWWLTHGDDKTGLVLIYIIS